jgi:hypothetical protein
LPALLPEFCELLHSKKRACVSYMTVNCSFYWVGDG